LITFFAIAADALMLMIAGFHVLLSAGAPWGAFAWGGSSAGVLPTKLRIASAASALFWIAMAIIVADHGEVISAGIDRSATLLVIRILTVLLAIGTVLNLMSPSKKEKLLWTPVAACCCAACAYLSVYG
jgi:hypothetical protein